MKDRDLDDSVDVRERSVRDSVEPSDTAEPRDRAESRDTRQSLDTNESDSFLPPDRMEDLRERWNDVQAEFVDDPRTSVQKAHRLVSSLVNELNETFTRERSGLESQWNRGEEADTENLRVALQRYRAFFNRLLR